MRGDDEMQVTMFSSAEKVQGQGVGSAYSELIRLLKKYHSDEIQININQYRRTQLSHYHTIDIPFYITTFFRKRFGRRIGYVHFLPSTLKGSLHLPKIIEKILYRYVISFYKRMDHLVVVNPVFIEELVKVGIPREHITYIPNVVSNDQFFPYTDQEINALRAKKGLAQDRFVVFGAGQVQERKGVFDFIQLAEAMPDIQFIWAGGFSFGKITDGYEKYKYAMEHPPKNLLFTGIIQREDMRDYYQLADLFLLPSYEELFPMCILEAFACETPVMLRDLVLYKPVLEGYYEPAADQKEMAEKIVQLKNNPIDLQNVKKKAIAGNRFYAEEKTAELWKIFYQQQLAVYQKEQQKSHSDLV